MPLRRRLVWLLLVLVVGLVVDQGAKWLAIQHLPARMDPIVLLGGLVQLQYAENPGAMLGLGGDLSPQMRFWIFTVANTALLVLLLGYLLWGKGLRRGDVLGLSLILAGGIGNQIDRFVHDGIVIDYLLLKAGRVHLTGVFNLADTMIMVGVGWMLVASFWPSKPNPAPETVTPDATAA